MELVGEIGVFQILSYLFVFQPVVLTVGSRLLIILFVSNECLARIGAADRLLPAVEGARE